MSITFGDQSAIKNRAHAHEMPKTIAGFRGVHVFDVAQTDGEPLPDVAQASGDPGERLATLKAAIVNVGINLEYADDLDGALGTSHGGRIRVRNGLSPADELTVLAHEWAHELLHRGDDRPVSRDTRELEAEAVAFVVAESVGLDAIIGNIRRVASAGRLLAEGPLSAVGTARMSALGVFGLVLAPFALHFIPGWSHLRVTNGELGALGFAALGLAWAVALRGGFWLRACGIAVVMDHGDEVSRARAAVRALVAWSWVPLQVTALVLGWSLLTAPIWLIKVGAVVWAAVSPERGLQDRIAGTYLVPR